MFRHIINPESLPLPCTKCSRIKREEATSNDNGNINSIVPRNKKLKKGRLCGKLPVVHRQNRVPSTSLDKMVKRERENGV